MFTVFLFSIPVSVNHYAQQVKRNPKDIFFVGLQLILFAAYLFRFSKIDFRVPGWLQLIGLFFSVAGIIISLASILTLNKNLSPFPTPKESAQLIQSGIYKYIRHPIYSGILFFTFGFSMYSENTLRLLIFFMLLILFRFKAAYEEKLLQDKYSNYTDYKKRLECFYQGISKNFSFIKLNPKAAADAAKTEASSGAFIPIENVIAKAKISKSHPLSFAVNEVLNPIIKQNPNAISNRVDVHPKNGINDGAIMGFNFWVYFKKLLQLPHADTSLLHNPKRSATAERKPTPMDTRKKSFMIFTFIIISFFKGL